MTRTKEKLMKGIHTGSVALLLAASLPACGHDEDPDAEACTHLKVTEDKAVKVTANPLPAGAPAVADDHKRYDISLVDVTGGKGGHVAFAVDEAHDFAFFLGADVPVKFTDPMGMNTPTKSSATSSSACAEIKGKHVVPMSVGTYTVSFGPTTATAVNLVIEDAADVH